jgi:hypothetical protein
VLAPVVEAALGLFVASNGTIGIESLARSVGSRAANSPTRWRGGVLPSTGTAGAGRRQMSTPVEHGVALLDEGLGCLAVVLGLAAVDVVDRLHVQALTQLAVHGPV